MRFKKCNLLKYLGNFIPFFSKRAMNKERLLAHLELEIKHCINNYELINDFTVNHGLIVSSNVLSKYVKIEYIIVFHNIEFSLFIEYNDNAVKLKFKPIEREYTEELFPIIDFVKYFYANINKESLVTLFKLVNL